MKIVVLIAGLALYFLVIYKITSYFEILTIGKLRVRKNKVIAYYLEDKTLFVVTDNKTFELSYATNPEAYASLKYIEKRLR